MRRALIIAVLAFAMAGCSPPSTATPDAEASAPSGGPLSEADRASILGALNLSPSASGEIVNECGDNVTPTIAPAELGGAVGTAHLVAIPGGPSLYTCYGDGPDLHLMMRDGAGWREIYAARGRMLIIMPGVTNGVRDLADGGPGFQFPLWQWNGSAYANTGRSVSDTELANATFLP
jgi:hypothetical protein